RQHPPLSSPSATTPFLLNALHSTHTSPLSLHDALPIWPRVRVPLVRPQRHRTLGQRGDGQGGVHPGVGGHHAPVDDVQSGLNPRSEEHTSELQSLTNLVCRLLLDKKNPNVCGPHWLVVG